MRQMEIDDEGLDSTDRKLLAAIIQKFASGPVGVQALAAVLSEEVETIEDVYEPFLLRLGFLDRTPQGRIATESARAHLASSASRSRRRAAPSRTCRASGTPRRSDRRRSVRGPRPAARRRLDTRPPRPAGADPRRRRDAPVHARRDERDGQGPRSRGHRRDRRVDHPREHLPPLPAAGPRADRPARRPAPVHGLGQADPHRLRRVPGRVARRPAGRRRRRE